MRTEPEFIVELTAARVTQLTPEQERILAYLLTLDSETIRRCSQRFKRRLSGAGNAIPRTKGAAQALTTALNIGLRLNCLHPAPAVASHWLTVHEAGGITLPWRAWMSDDGMPEFSGPSFELPTRRRRQRLKQLPKDWLPNSLSLAERCNDELHAAILVVALTGCRPAEVASIEATLAGDAGHLNIQCAKTGFQRTRYRELNLRPESVMSEWIVRLCGLVRKLPLTHPFSGVNAKAIENGIQRISDDLLKRQENALTASCYRNQLAADLKRDGIPEEEISYCLGHASLRTKSMYGTYQQGKPGRRGYLSLAQSWREQEVERERYR